MRKKRNISFKVTEVKITEIKQMIYLSFIPMLFRITYAYLFDVILRHIY